MNIPGSKRAYNLSTLIGGAVFLSLLALLLPGVMLIKFEVESRLVEDRHAVVENVNSGWAEQLNIHLTIAEESVKRFAGIISSIDDSESRERLDQFRKLVVEHEDGALRSEPDSFDAQESAGIWIPKSTSVNAAYASFLLEAKSLTEAFGKGALVEIVDTWVLPKEGGIVIYWPTEPGWIYGADAELDFVETEWVSLTRPETSDGSDVYWTSTSFDPAPEVWMISVVAPFTRDGEWAGAVGHDLPIEVLTGQLVDVVLYPGTEYYLVKSDGALILSNKYERQILESDGALNLADTEASDLVSLLNSETISVNGNSAKFATTVDRIVGPDWYFISRTPHDEMLSAVQSTYNAIWIVGILAVVVCSLLAAFLFSRLILPSINRLLTASHAIADGDLDYEFEEERVSEFRAISNSIDSMVQKLKVTLSEVDAARKSFEGLVSSIPGAVYRCKCKDDWEVIFVSDYIETITGYPASDFVDNKVRSYASIIHPDDREMVTRTVMDGIERRQPYDIEYRIAHRDGSVRWILEKGQAEFHENGDPVWLEGTFFDESQKKLLELQRDESESEKRKLERQLQQSQKMQALGTLAGGVAHDFNNVLGSIIGYTEMAKAEVPPDSPVAADLDEVMASAYRAGDLVKQILAFSRQGEQLSQVVNPAIIVSEALKMLRPSIPATIDIDERIDPDCGMISADPSHIQQIIVNLCTNAFHSMEESGGRLTVILRASDEGPAEAFTSASNGWVELKVIDNGPGIDPSIIDKIFEPYFTTKQFGKGTGMGLSMVHGMVSSHDGHISATSVPGRETVFTVHFPIVEAEVEQPAEKRPEHTTGNGHGRILIVDDEQSLANIAETMLTKSGYEATSMYSARDALALFTKDPEAFDLVITDQTMPEMTGAELAEKILRIRSDIPVILCTGYSSIMSEEKAREIGIRDFLSKPFSMSELAQRVATHLK